MAQFKCGQEKPSGSGRKKGTPNKKSQLLEDIFASNNFNVPEQLISLLPKLSPDKQATILLSLMDYIYPKRKSVESSQRETAGDNHITVTFVEAKNGRPIEIEGYT
nr:hypothetical protein CKG001_02140 [Bdellovibrio sp. CKG001]